MLRKAAAAAPYMPTPARPVLRPPVDLDAIEREAFADIVLTAPVGHLLSCDVPWIAHLARSVVLARVAFGEMKAVGHVVDGKVSPWLNILQHASKEMRSTARLLSLTPASYRPTPKLEDEPVSYYTRMSMLESHPDDEPEPN
jgi:hypothetical protein